MSKTILSQSDEWATPMRLCVDLCLEHGFDPELDVAANFKNRKCLMFLSERDDALKQDWLYEMVDGRGWVDVWCNPPHSQTKAFVEKAHEQWQKHNLNIMMLVPVDTTFTKYFEPIEEHVEVHKVRPRPSFINPLQEKRAPAKRNYVVIIWRRRKG